MTESWKPVKRCPQCGGETGIEGARGQCQFCGAELSLMSIPQKKLPSEYVPQKLDQLRPEEVANNPDLKLLHEAAKRFLPDQAFLEDPIAYLASQGKTFDEASNKELELSLAIVDIFEQTYTDFFEFLEKSFKEQRAEYTERAKYEVAFYTRFLKWAYTQQSVIDEAINKVMPHMVDQARHPYEGRNYSKYYQIVDIPRQEQIEKVFDPIGQMKSSLRNKRGNILGSINHFLSQSTRESIWSAEGYKIFRAQTLDNLVKNVDRFPTTYAHEIRSILEVLLDPMLARNDHQRKKTAGVNYEFELDFASKSLKQLADDEFYMTVTDRLIEILSEPEVYAVILDIGEEFEELGDSTGFDSGDKKSERRGGGTPFVRRFRSFLRGSNN